jgi:hypothetical protein
MFLYISPCTLTCPLMRRMLCRAVHRPYYSYGHTMHGSLTDTVDCTQTVYLWMRGGWSTCFFLFFFPIPGLLLGLSRSCPIYLLWQGSLHVTTSDRLIQTRDEGGGPPAIFISIPGLVLGLGNEHASGMSSGDAKQKGKG